MSGGFLAPRSLAPPSTTVGQDPREAERQPACRRRQSGQLGHPADELLLGDALAVGHVENLADRQRARSRRRKIPSTRFLT